MANLPADLPTNWTQGQIISPNGTEVGLTEQHGYNYLNEQVNAAQEEVNTLSQEVDALSQEVSGAASQASVDNIAETIGTTTDSGATSTTGTLMGKVNAVLDNTSSLSDFYYMSDTERETLISSSVSAVSTKSAVYLSLGHWVAQKDGVITVMCNCKSTIAGCGTFFASIAKWGVTAHFMYTTGGASLEYVTPGIPYDMISTPIGSTISNGYIPGAGLAINFNMSRSNANYKYSLNVKKGDTLFFFSQVEASYDSDDGTYSKCTATINSLKICYADEPQE